MTVHVADHDVTMPMAWRSTTELGTAGSWRIQRPLLKPEKCTGCNVCWKFCPEPAIEIVGKIVFFDLTACKGCGVCADVCAPKAIEMVAEE